MSSFTKKEVFLINELATKDRVLSQRNLAQKAGISIGLLNAVLRQLIHKGYVKAKRLNKKKIQYLLTPRGAVLAVRFSYSAILNTLRNYQQLETDIIKIINQHIENGHNNFFLHGQGQFAEIVKRIIRRNLKSSTTIIENLNGNKNVIILNLTDAPIKMEGNVVNLAECLKNSLNNMR